MIKKVFFDSVKIPLFISGIFAVSLCMGCVYCSLLDIGKSIETKEYLSAFFNSVQKLSSEKVMIDALKSISVSYIAILIASFFKAGIALNIAVILKHGFIMGVTFTSFFRFFGLKGILANLIMIPEAIVLISALIFFSSTSTKMAFFSMESKKKFFVFFMIFSFISATIFCAYSFLNGFLTTIFMKLIAKLF